MKCNYFVKNKNYM